MLVLQEPRGAVLCYRGFWNSAQMAYAQKCEICFLKANLASRSVEKSGSPHPPFLSSLQTLS